jgi:hypothetical protein
MLDERKSPPPPKADIRVLLPHRAPRKLQIEATTVFHHQT